MFSETFGIFFVFFIIDFKKCVEHKYMCVCFDKISFSFTNTLEQYERYSVREHLFIDSKIEFTIAYEKSITIIGGTIKGEFLLKFCSILATAYLKYFAKFSPVWQVVKKSKTGMIYF